MEPHTTPNKSFIFRIPPTFYFSLALIGGIVIFASRLLYRVVQVHAVGLRLLEVVDLDVGARRRFPL